MKIRQRVRNAAKARQSFVTRRAELKIGALSEMIKAAAGERCVKVEKSVLQRELFFNHFTYLRSLKLIYNWENRFMAVNYNLQMTSLIPAEPPRFEEVHSCRFVLRCTQKGLRGKREFQWLCQEWGDSEERLAAYLERLNNPLITARLDALDIFEMELRHSEGSGEWLISLESLIGSATWILIPPVMSMITPKREECVKFLELFELIADAVANNV